MICEKTLFLVFTVHPSNFVLGHGQSIFLSLNR